MLVSLALLLAGARAARAEISFAGPPVLATPPPAPPAPVLPAGIAPTPWAFALGDLDGDGLIDVVGIGPDGCVLRVWRNLGGGAFAAPVAYPLVSGCARLALGDFNGDGHPDVVSARGRGVTARTRARIRTPTACS